MNKNWIKFWVPIKLSTATNCWSITREMDVSNDASWKWWAQFCNHIFTIFGICTLIEFKLDSKLGYITSNPKWSGIVNLPWRNSNMTVGTQIWNWGEKCELTNQNLYSIQMIIYFDGPQITDIFKYCVWPTAFKILLFTSLYVIKDSYKNHHHLFIIDR